MKTPAQNQNHHVPLRRWLKLLEWFCPPALYEGIEGDLLQKYDDDLREIGERKARARLAKGVLQFFRPEIILRNRFAFQLINTIMIYNYLIIAFRNVWKNKVFSFINIFGLAIGLAACLLIFQFVTFELSYDHFNEKLDRTYRITNDRFQNGKLIQHGTIMYPTIGPVMAKDFPEIELHTRLMPGGDMNIKVGERNFRGDNCHFVDENFLSVFSFPMLAGEKNTALKERYSVVLTEHTARKYFSFTGNDFSELLGKTFYWALDTQPYTVKGICSDVPLNSHIQFDALVAYATLISPEQHGADDSWTWSDMRHYLVLKPGVDYKQLEAKFPAFSNRYFQGDKVSGSIEKFYLQPLSQAHLYSDYEYDIAKRANGKAVWAMLVVALFILMIAWINYINLTTSRALDRAKEVGLRKVMGAFKSQLIKQFIFESLMITSLAFVIALILVQALQSSFNQITGYELSLAKIFADTNKTTIITLLLLLLAGALLSGFYPAFVLSSYQPVTVLKGKFQRSSAGAMLRKALVIFQFTSSAALITGTIIVSKQLTYMNNADLGINIDNTLIVEAPELMPWDSTFIQRTESYKQELQQINGVVTVATSGNLPGHRLGRGFGLRLTEQPSTAKHTMSFLGADYNFLQTYGVSLLAGRYFLPTDHNANYNKIRSVILNKNAITLLGMSTASDAIGKELTDGEMTWTIIGVVSDFHQQSLKAPMEPMLFIPSYSTYATTSVRMKTDNVKSLVSSVEKVYARYFPGNSFEYYFLKDSYSRQYSDDTRFGKIISIFTVLAIIVSCMGLIGLSSYMAIQRTKEIGVRKVLGASIVSIVSLLSMDFIRLVVAAALLSVPIAYFGMQNWLQSYAYRITPGWMQFVTPLLMVLFIAALTISFQVVKAATKNPADTLKHE